MARTASLVLAVALTGCATENSVDYQNKIDTWAQAPNNQVDILWVVDDSFSMAEEQAVLASGFASFASQLEDSQTDFQIGIITTSFDYSDPNAGVLIGDPPFLTQDDVDYEAAFTARSTVGTDGSDKEKGLEAALFALDPLMTFAGAPNEGFVRKEAQLLVVFVSDEEDCSDNGALEGQPPTDCYTQSEKLTPIQTVVQDLRDIKNDDTLVQVSAIVGLAGSSCDAVEGSRYHQVAAFTGGTVGDICRSDWSGMMAELGLTATGVRANFQLSSAAQPDTLEVFVDDMMVEQDDQRGYTYDEETWFITFHKDAVPARGATISASYTVDPGKAEPVIE